MGSIRRLDGEVVKLLRSQVAITDIGDVIKELLENGIDSGASEVTVRFQLQDIYQVWCTDNGCGITEEGLQSVGQRYNTSKAAAAAGPDALKDCTTYGFRGEALHSIISVCSSVTIASKTKKAAFTGGAPRPALVASEEPARGTSVVASNIFGNMPVRLRQLRERSDLQVIDRIRGVVFKIAVVNPGVSIRLLVVDPRGNEQIVCSCGEVTPRASPKYAFPETLKSVYGISIAEQLGTVDAHYDRFKVSGQVASRQSRERTYQTIMIGKRYVADAELYRTINRVLKGSNFVDVNEVVVPNFARKDISPKKGQSPVKVAGRTLPSHPIFFFQIECPASISDLIQDPSKAISSPAWADVIRVLIMRSLKRFLESQGLEMEETDVADVRRDLRGEFQPVAKRLKVGSAEGMSQGPCECTLPGTGVLAQRSVFFAGAEEVQISRHDLEHAHVVGQVDAKFILVKIVRASGAFLAAVDQHACDERIKVERLLQEFMDATVLAAEPQRESVSVAVDGPELDLAPRDLEMVLQYRESLEIWGFWFVVRADRVTVSRVPAVLGVRAARDTAFVAEVLLEHCRDLVARRKPQWDPGRAPADWWTAVRFAPRGVIEAVNSRACRSAVMFGTRLSADECRALLCRVRTCRLPLQCAHGRPSVVPLVDLR